MPTLHYDEMADLFAAYVAANPANDVQPIHYIIRNHRNGMAPTCVCVQLILYMGSIAYKKNKGAAYADVLVPQLCAAINCRDILPPCLWLYTIMLAPAQRYIDVVYDICTIIEHTMRRIAHHMNMPTADTAAAVIYSVQRICRILARCDLGEHYITACQAIYTILTIVNTRADTIAPALYAAP